MVQRMETLKGVYPGGKKVLDEDVPELLCR
jgi:hypothetical protein